MSFAASLRSTLARSLRPAAPRAAPARCLSRTTPPRARLPPALALRPQRRYNSTEIPVNGPAVPIGKLTPEEQAALSQQPSYQLTFTCRPCRERSTHTVTKQAYHKGSVLIACPGCKSRHVLADHLKIFGETARSLEDILKEKGEVLKRGRILPGGDVEILPPEEGAAEAQAAEGAAEAQAAEGEKKDA